MRVLAFGTALAILAAFGQPAVAQSADSRRDELWTRPALLDGPGSPKEALRSYGIILDTSLTQFYQAVVSGDGEKQWQYGGKIDLLATFDGAKLGFWHGFYVTIHQEWLYGEDVNLQGEGTLIPTNAALGFPRLGGYERDTSIVITQNFGEAFSVSGGKFNMLDVAAKTPLVGGGGIDTFMNIAIAAPISGVTPPYLFGAVATLKTQPAIFTVMVYDPRNAQDWDVIENPFDKGTTTSLSVTVPTKIAGLTGYYGVRGVYSSKTGLDLADIPQLLLPPAADGTLTKGGYWYAGATVQQYLVQDTRNPAIGWGLFGEVGFSDGNPNPYAWHVIAGIGGNNTAEGRQLDRWGIAYFRYALSDDLIRSLSSLGLKFADEQGVEAYYNWAIAPWLRLTGNIQWIDTGALRLDDAVVAALRLQTKF